MKINNLNLVNKNNKTLLRIYLHLNLHDDHILPIGNKSFLSQSGKLLLLLILVGGVGSGDGVSLNPFSIMKFRKKFVV
jgi:hypothetical protein